MAIERFRLPDGQEVVFDEWLQWPVYSVVEWAAASRPDLRAFGYVRGGSVPTVGLPRRTATPTDTNQLTSSRMNWDESYRLFSVTYEAWGLTDATIDSSPPLLVAAAPGLSAINHNRLRRDLMAEVLIGADIEKPEFRAPFSYIHQGPGPVVYTVGDSPGPGIAFTNGTGGDVSWQRQRRFALPVKIGGDRVMKLRQWSPTGPVQGLNQDIRIRWYLDGVRRRPLG